MAAEFFKKNVILYFQISTGNWYVHLMLAITFFLIFRWFMSKLNKSRKTQNLVSLFTSILIAPLLYRTFFFFYLLWLFRDQVEPAQKFKSDKWQTKLELRYTMIDDLMTNYDLVESSRAAITEILGKPSERFIQEDSLNVWVYDMGTQQAGFGIEGHYLNIYFTRDKVDSLVHESWRD